MREPGHLSAQALHEAAACIAAGGLVGFPTETVYGLGARADDDTAVAKIFAAKGRPSEHPLIVHVASMAAAEAFASELSGDAHSLMQHFWPGPLTLIVPRLAGRAAAAAGGQDSIGLRMPSHPVARALLREAAHAGVSGIAAPSANRFGRVSPTTAAHVRDEFGPGLLVLDGGPCEVGIESTIVDCRMAQPVLLRPGGVERRPIEAVLGRVLLGRQADSPRAPGLLAAHYAPSAKVVLMEPLEMGQRLQQFGPAGAPFRLAVYSRTAPPAVAKAEGGFIFRPMPADAAAAARELFAVLRGLDTLGVQQVWVEMPPHAPDWEGVQDRLQRAAAA